MSAVHDGGPAFPLHIPTPMAGDASETIPGMSLRDYFAAKALAELIRGAIVYRFDEDAQRAYSYADAMLKARAAA